MDAQFQIRQNAMEMQEYMKDLFDWQKSIKKKERALSSSMDTSGAQAPAPRGRANGAVAPAAADLMQPALGPKGPAAAPKAARAAAAASASTSTAKQSGPPDAAGVKKTAAAHTYTSYGKWDKFDVDAALASDDDEDAAAIGPSKGTARHGADPGASAGGEPVSAGPQAASGLTAAGRAAPAASVDPSPLQTPGIILSATDPAAPRMEDLLKPVATTRLTKTPAAAAAAAAADGGGGAMTAAAAAAATLPPIRNTQPTSADAWRARGNDLFKAGEYDSAYECYSRSIEMQPTCLGHANRAMALLKLSRWQEAVADCTAALQLDPAYVKALQRRAAAHRQLGAALQAARDWEAALRLEPDNRATAADRDAALAALLAEQKLQPPSRRAAVPLLWVLPPAAAAAAAEAAAERPAEQPPSGGGGSSNGGGGGSGSSRVEDLAAAGTQGASAPPAAVAAAPPPPTEPAPPQRQPSASATPAAAPPTPAAAAAVSLAAAAAAAKSAAAAAAAAEAAAAAPASRGVPRTSVEFEAAWRGLAGDPVRQAAYLSAIPPASLPAVFKNSLTAPVLASLVRCLLAAIAPPPGPAAAATAGADAADAPSASSSSAPSSSLSPRGGVSLLSPARGVALLEGLTRVARFDLMAMSVPSRERRELAAAWEALTAQLAAALGAGAGPGGEAGEAEAAAASLTSLRSKYRL